jgi:hypothetical protein
MKHEFTNVNAISTIRGKKPHIAKDYGWYTCRPDAEHQGHFFSVSRHVNPADLRLMADLIEADRAKEKAKSNDQT